MLCASTIIYAKESMKLQNTYHIFDKIDIIGWYLLKKLLEFIHYIYICVKLTRWYYGRSIRI